MKRLRWLVIFLSLSVDIKLKAIEQEPPACLTKDSHHCSLFTFAPRKVQIGEAEVTLYPGAILYRDQSKVWNLLSGTVRVESAAPFRMNTKVGSAHLGRGTQWMQWKNEKLWIFAIEGDARVDLHSTAMGENLVESGFFNWFGLINGEGVNLQGVPRPMESTRVSSILPMFLKHKDRKVIDKKLARHLASAGDMYSAVIAKMDLDRQEKQAEIDRRENNRRQFEKGLRDLYRNKYLGPVDLEDAE